MMKTMAGSDPNPTWVELGPPFLGGISNWAKMGLCRNLEEMQHLILQLIYLKLGWETSQVGGDRGFLMATVTWTAVTRQRVVSVTRIFHENEIKHHQSSLNILLLSQVVELEPAARRSRLANLNVRSTDENIGKMIFVFDI